MFAPTRRRFLTGAAALAAFPTMPHRVLGQVPSSGEVDVAIVGAGAAGIAAARRIGFAGKTYALLEASDRVGGRIFSDVRPFGIPYDRGAHRTSASGRNPLVALGRLLGAELYEPALFRRLYVGQREARDREYDNFTAALHRASRAIAAAGEAGLDLPAARTLPNLGEWQPTVSFVLGPLTISKDLDEVSALDLARAEGQPDELLCRGGMSRLIAAVAKTLTAGTDTAVNRIDTRSRGVAIETARGTIRAGAVIVTPSTSALSAGLIKFDPVLPKRTMDALAGLSLGTRDRLVFELPGNPLRLADDQRAIFRAGDSRNVGIVGRVGGTDLAYAEFAGRFGREMSDQGGAAMAAFVSELLVAHFGSEAKKYMGRSEAVRWSRDPWVLGGISVASPGSGANRRLLAEPVSDRIFFAGEALHEGWWGTVAGAWISGERAATAVLRVLDRTSAPAKGVAAPRKQQK
jgi:monoamine oxidase